jgi:hypothetical protein
MQMLNRVVTWGSLATSQDGYRSVHPSMMGVLAEAAYSPMDAPGASRNASFIRRIARHARPCHTPLHVQERRCVRRLLRWLQQP